jgi:hypothetical protein
MTQRTAARSKTAFGGLLAAAVTSGMFGASALGAAPAANATCASFFGIGNGGGCTSTPFSVAIAIGSGATAYAGGLFGSAIAYGTGSIAYTEDAGIFTSAAALGDHSYALTGGVASLTLAVGSYTASVAASSPGTQIGNIALNFTSLEAASHAGEQVYADGFGAIAANFGGTSADVRAYGTFTTAINVLGTNHVYAGEVTDFQGDIAPNFASLAFSLFGSGNHVQAGPSVLTLAGSIAQTSAHVTKTGSGFNINGVTIGSAAAPAKATKAATTVSAASVTSTKKRAAGSVAAVKHTTKK